MVLRPAMMSSASGLRDEVRNNARASFSFFVKNALGRRKHCEYRLEALAAGKEEPSLEEQKLLQSWNDLKAGRVPSEMGWLEPAVLEMM